MRKLKAFYSNEEEKFSGDLASLIEDFPNSFLDFIVKYYLNLYGASHKNQFSF